MNARIPSLVLTERSKNLLSYLFNHKAATFQQIHRDLFPGVVKSVPSTFTGKLLAQKWISKEMICFQGKFKIIYRLDEGAKEFFAHLNEEALSRQQLLSGTIEHDVCLVDLRARLLKFKRVKKIYTENTLQCVPEYRADPEFIPFIKVRSDSVVEVVDQGEPVLVALELELSKKSPQRYEAKMKDYYKWKKIAGVLFVSGSGEIQSAVQRMEQLAKADEHPKVFYAALQSVLEERSELTFLNLAGGKFTLH